MLSNGKMTILVCCSDKTMDFLMHVVFFKRLKIIINCPQIYYRMTSWITSSHSSRNMEKARNLWQEMYRGEPFDLNLKDDWSNRKLPRYNSRLSYDILSAVQKEEDFFYQVRSGVLNFLTIILVKGFYWIG